MTLPRLAALIVACGVGIVFLSSSAIGLIVGGITVVAVVLDTLSWPTSRSTHEVVTDPTTPTTPTTKKIVIDLDRRS